MRKKMRWLFLLGGCALVSLPQPALANRTINTDFTQSGGTFEVDPAGRLLISHATNDPTLTLTNGATTSGVRGVTVAEGTGPSAWQTGHLVVEDASVLSNTGSAKVGSLSGVGTATVSGAGSQWTNTLGFLVGHNGDGTLNILNGGVVTNSTGYVGSEYSTSTATVSGTGSHWQNNDGLLIGGYEASGTLNIMNGGLVTNQHGVVGTFAYGTGVVTVSGSNSRWESSGKLDVGLEGKGTLTVEQQGVVTSVGATVSLTDTSRGVATVTGSGSRWENEGTFQVGSQPTAIGKLSVDDGGVVASTELLSVGNFGTLTGNGGVVMADVSNAGLVSPGLATGLDAGVLTIDGDFSQSGRMLIELAGTNAFDQLIVGGQASLGGVIDINLIDGFSPVAGNSFQILDFGSFVDAGYAFDFTDAPLSHWAWSWDTSQFDTTGVITVVPEPSSLVLAGVALIGGWLIRRRATRG